jgi:hypothetical protein
MSFNEILPLAIVGGMAIGMLYMMFRAIFLSLRSSKSGQAPEAELKKGKTKA